MTNNKPDHAFILAAGKGTRMRPHTNNIPKPMVIINDRPIIDYTVEKLENAGVKNITINLYYLGDRIENHFKDKRSPNITFSKETELLETGGGVKLALHTMDNEPFYLINGDAFWNDKKGEKTALEQLKTNWNPEKMDILLLLQPVNNMSLTKGVGDYNIDKDGIATRTPDKSGAYMFTGIRIVNPKVFKDTPDGAFSFLECMDKAQKNKRLYGTEYKGNWHHISTPEDLKNINNTYYEEG